MIEDYFQSFKENSHETARFNKIDPSLVLRWLQSKDKINSKRGTSVRKIRSKGGHFEEIEEQLYNSIINRRVIQKRSISFDDMRDKTKHLINVCEDQSVYANFKISNLWLQNFMERYHLSVRSPTHKAQENSKKTHEK